MATTPARPLATCILRWIYEQVSALLQLLKQFLLGILAWIDAQIAKLRAIVAQWDLLAKAEELLYNTINDLIEQLRSAMLGIPKGPLSEFCPEFYAYFLDPAVSLFDSTVAVLDAVRQRYKSKLSLIYWLDQAIAYWEQIKADLVSAIDILDDAIHQALLVEAAEAVP